MDEFLNPKSMLTPGFTGAVTMAIGNALAGLFQSEASGWFMLAISFLFGCLILVGPTISWLERAVFYVINSLIIFCVAVGTNAAGRSIQISSLQPERTSYAYLENTRESGAFKITSSAVAAELETQLARTQSENGAVCKSSADCRSGYCYPGPEAKPFSDLKYCMKREMNCALPDFDGARYGAVISKDDTLLECGSRKGENARFYRYRPGFFKPLFK